MKARSLTITTGDRLKLQVMPGSLALERPTVDRLGTLLELGAQNPVWRPRGSLSSYSSVRTLYRRSSYHPVGVISVVAVYSVGHGAAVEAKHHAQSSSTIDEATDVASIRYQYEGRRCLKVK